MTDRRYGKEQKQGEADQESGGMSRTRKDGEAFSMIDAFAEQLLAINEGKAIPTSWKIRLKKALQPRRRTQGRKKNLVNVRKIVKLLTQKRHEIPAERTKHNNPAVIIAAIAEKVVVSRRTVSRYRNGLAQLDTLPTDEREACIQGMAEAIAEEVRADW